MPVRDRRVFVFCLESLIRIDRIRLWQFFSRGGALDNTRHGHGPRGAGSGPDRFGRSTVPQMGERDATPRFSVIMPTHNVASFIDRAISSVQAQDERDWELLIVDDGSQDMTKTIIEQFTARDPRIRATFLDGNYGAAVARNTAIASARGRYIAFIDSDDFWFPEKLTRQRRLLEESGAPLVYSVYHKVDASGRLDGRTVKVPEKIDYRGLLKATVIATVTAVYDRERVGLVLMPEILKRQDYALWLKILRRGGYARGAPEALAALRKRPGSVSSNKVSAMRFTWRVYRECEQLGRVASAYNFTHYALRAVGKSLI